MKLRIDQQNIRFRLSTQDLEILASAGLLVETLQLAPDVIWGYSVEASNDISDARVEVDSQNLKVMLPQDKLTSWISSHEIEWHFDIDRLSIDIEKDLKSNRH